MGEMFGSFDAVEVWAAVVAFKVIALTLLYKWHRINSAKGGGARVDEERLLRWRPRPLVEEVEGDIVEEEPVVIGKLSECDNFGATSFLRLGGERRAEEEAVAALRKYGVGSCGPRGFYGTIDVHLELEERLAKFMGVEEACVYSYGFSTVASAIPAYAKKRDLIFADERVNFAIQKGLNASRSDVHFFRHNDADHLEELLASKADEILKKRSFLIAEGIYFNTGRLCPLRRLVELRKKYKLRLILDESLTVGVLGAKGKGLTEFFDIPVSDVDLIVCSLEHSFGSIGGFCAGSSFIVEHQRLSGLGYCFSASLPPLLSQSAITSLDFIQSEPHRMENLRINSEKLDRALSKLEDFEMSGHALSPIKHLYIKSETMMSSQKEQCLKAISRHCLKNGIAVATSAYLSDAEYNCPEPSIRIASNSLMTDEQIEKLTTLLEEGRRLAKVSH